MFPNVWMNVEKMWCVHMCVCVYTCIYTHTYTQASLVAQLVKNLPAMQENLVQFLGQEDPLEKE